MSTCASIFGVRIQKMGNVSHMTEETTQGHLSESGESEQFVTFRIGEEDYATAILDVQEIISTGEITPYPNSSAYLLGVINVRGTVAKVVSLAKLFGIPSTVGSSPENNGYIILTKKDETLIGMLVDTVNSVLKFDKDLIQPVSAISSTATATEFIQGAAMVNETMLLILDVPHILNKIELQ